MCARWVKSRWLTARAMLSSCFHGRSRRARSQMIVKISSSADTNGEDAMDPDHPFDTLLGGVVEMR